MCGRGGAPPARSSKAGTGGWSASGATGRGSDGDPGCPDWPGTWIPPLASQLPTSMTWRQDGAESRVSNGSPGTCEVARTVSVLPPTLIDGALKNQARPRRRPKAWMSSSRWTRPQRPATRVASERPRRSLMASSSDFDTTSAQVVRPSNRPSSPSSQRSISDGVSRPTRFPGYWKTGWDRSTPARIRHALPQIGLSECSASRAMNAS